MVTPLGIPLSTRMLLIIAFLANRFLILGCCDQAGASATLRFVGGAARSCCCTCCARC